MLVAAIAVLIEYPLDGLGDQMDLFSRNKIFQEFAYARRRSHSAAHVDAESSCVAATPSDKAQVVDRCAGAIL